MQRLMNEIKVLQARVRKYESVIVELEAQVSGAKLTAQQPQPERTSNSRVQALERELQAAREREGSLVRKAQRAQEYEQAYRESVR